MLSNVGRRWSWAAFGFGAIGIGACVFDSTDTQLRSPTADASLPDAPAPVGEDEEGGLDGGPNDAGWCDGGATFCDDFDHDPLGARWTSTSIEGGAELALDPTRASSLPNGLRVKIPEGAPPGTHAHLSRALEGVGYTETCTVNVLLDALPASEVAILALEVGRPATSDVMLTVWVSATVTRLELTAGQDAEAVASGEGPPLPTGQWVPILLGAGSQPLGHAAVLRAGDAEVNLSQVNVIDYPRTSVLDVGARAGDAGSGIVVHYDDVVFTVF